MSSRFICAIFLATRLGAGDTARVIDEYVVKAAFLCSFAKFVDWPPEVFGDSAQPLVICVLGVDPFGTTLDNVAKDKSTGGRSFAIRRISDASQMSGCRILFVSPSERRPVSVNEPGVLTIGESANAVSAGSIITFVLENGKVRFAIDPAAAKREHLRIGSRLLDLAVNLKK